MSLLVDASVALKWVLGEPDSEAALALREEELIAPVLWLAEAANALWRGARIGQLNLDDAVDLLDELTKRRSCPWRSSRTLNRPWYWRPR